MLTDYFISYSYLDKSGNTGLGNVQYRGEGFIDSLEDVNKLARDIEEKNGFKKNSCIVLNFIKLKDDQTGNRFETVRSLIADLKSFDQDLPDRESIIANFHETIAALEAEIKGLEELL